MKWGGDVIGWLVGRSVVGWDDRVKWGWLFDLIEGIENTCSSRGAAGGGGGGLIGVGRWGKGSQAASIHEPIRPLGRVESRVCLTMRH